MALLDRTNLMAALKRLGELTAADGDTLELIIVGGAVMLLEFDARPSTQDLDAVTLSGPDPAKVRRYAEIIAIEFGWPNDWLNDAVKGYLTGTITTKLILELPGLRIFRPSIEQLLAMKLCAWRDDIDVSDASILLAELPRDRAQAWSLINPFLQPGRELIASYAFDDLWEDVQ